MTGLLFRLGARRDGLRELDGAPTTQCNHSPAHFTHQHIMMPPVMSLLASSQSRLAGQAKIGQISCGAVAPRPQCSCSARQPLAPVSRQHRSHTQSHICSAAGAAAAQAGKLLSKSEVPAFIPREDLMDQLVRWSLINAQEEGVAQFGLPMKVVRHTDVGPCSSFKVTIMSREGATLTNIGLNFDDESSNKFDWVGRGADGFPAVEGEATEVAGKHLEIRQACCPWSTRCRQKSLPRSGLR